jgi:gliding motility-associated-like protein
MKIMIKPFVFLFLVATLSNTSVFALNSTSSYISEGILPTPPPTVTTPVYLCQNSVAVPLTATPSGGGTLNWYSSAVVGGSLPRAPTPITTAVGSTTYYVTQTISGVESTPRIPIMVNVVANTGASIVGFFCNFLAPLPDGTRSVLFDWGNDPLAPGATYNYTYTILGGLSGSGSTTNASTNATISGVQPGQSVSLTITSLTQYPCVLPQTMTCTVPCGASTVTPTFGAIPTTYCQNAIPSNLPTSSTNAVAITGTWSPLIINTSTLGTTDYVFTPDAVLFPCATTKKLSVTVELIEPDFSDLAICTGGNVPALNTTSPNGITGSWLPLVIDNMANGSYVFTTDPNQCATASKTINVTVSPSNTLVSADWTVTEAFAANQVVTINSTSAGNYLYQLDNGPFQQSPIFEHVAYGTHTATVIDANGCSTPITIDNILVIDYPKIFTPNGDSFNDSWNIFSLADQTGSTIRIFDRYGKFLKEISPLGPGWDGTHNGHPLPATDYWFVVEYSEASVSKIFKSHFSLKR